MSHIDEAYPFVKNPCKIASGNWKIFSALDSILVCMKSKPVRQENFPAIRPAFQKLQNYIPGRKGGFL